MINNEIFAFLRRTGMPETTFGRRTISDPRLIQDLREGRVVRPATAAKLKAFMDKYRGD